MTLDVLRLSDWLNASASCVPSRKGVMCAKEAINMCGLAPVWKHGSTSTACREGYWGLEAGHARSAPETCLPL